MEFKTPISLKIEHEELHTMLKQATQLWGKTGEAAKTVAELMHPHFVKEEEYALPLLGLLPLLSSEKFSEEMKQVLIMTDRLKTELPEMLAEHKQIVAALEVSVQHATTEHHPEVAEFAEKLMLHAQTEEEVSYTTECESIIDVADIEKFSCLTCGVCFRQVIDGLRTIFQLYNWIIGDNGASFGASISTISVQNSVIFYNYSASKVIGTNRYKSV